MRNQLHAPDDILRLWKLERREIRMTQGRVSKL